MAEAPFNTIHRYKLICDRLGIDHGDLDGKSPADSMQIIDRALDKIRIEGEESSRVLNVGHEVKMGDAMISIKALPWADEIEWCKNHTRKMREIAEFEHQLIERKNSEGTTDSDIAVIGLELLDYVRPRTIDLVRDFIGDIPRDATYAQIQRALEVARELSFPFGQMSQAAQDQIKRSSNNLHG